MRCILTAPKTVALNIVLAKKQIIVAPGDSHKDVDLTGDEVGVVEEHLRNLHRELRIEAQDQGSVRCPERDDFKAAVGSKKHRADHAAEYVEGVHKGEKKAAKEAAKTDKKAA